MGYNHARKTARSPSGAGRANLTAVLDVDVGILSRSRELFSYWFWIFLVSHVSSNNWDDAELLTNMFQMVQNRQSDELFCFQRTLRAFRFFWWLISKVNIWSMAVNWCGGRADFLHGALVFGLQPSWSGPGFDDPKLKTKRDNDQRKFRSSNFRLYWKLPVGLAASMFDSRDVLQRRCETWEMLAGRNCAKCCVFP